MPATLDLTGPTVGFGGSNGPTNFNTTATVNGDTYAIFGTYSASYNAGGTFISINPTVAYTGVAPTAQLDTITLSYTQPYFDNSPGSWDGVYSQNIPFNISGVAPGSTFSGQLSYDGQGLGLITATGNGSFNGSNSANLTGLNGDTLTAVFDFTFNFGAGATPGALANSPAGVVPEPSEMLPVGLGLAGFLFVVARRRRDSLKKTA
ncbi:MAG TPA: PEP-CTERM sorting domain-containing protein [Bryobacteraceae bacterium]|nr:PEP-CTERM sorting domain-containing protein [Bryobacteraceae bacterium]